VSYIDIFKTKIQEGHLTELKEKRTSRILEAINFSSGTKDLPIKHSIDTLPNGLEVYFLKPGKEVFREKNPKKYDMKPVVGENNSKFSFSDVFKIISKVSMADKTISKILLIMIYRIAYMLDYQEISKNVVRFNPEKEIKDTLLELNEKTSSYFPEYGFIGFLHFLDILAWNEDIKYHCIDGIISFEKNLNTGRINNLLSYISVPSNFQLFIDKALATDTENKNNAERIDLELLYNPIAQLMLARGVCPARKKELLIWLSPYLYE
jgi:hypothetical protein